MIEYSDVEIRGVTVEVIENVRILREHSTVYNNKVDGGLQNKSFSCPGRSSGRAIVLPPMLSSALAAASVAALAKV